MKNLEELKRKLAAMESGKPKRAKWKPTGLGHQVRCLPTKDEEDLAYIVKWHYGVDNGRQMYCPSTHGDQCDFCDFAQYLKRWKDDDGNDKSEAKRKMDFEWFKKIDAATKHYVPIVLRKADSTDLDGPFLWEMTPKTYQACFKILTDDDYNEDHPDGGGLRVLTSLKSGLDLTVSLKKAGQNGNTTSFDLTEVEERKKPSAVIKGDEKAAQDLLKKVPDISEIAKPISSAEATLIFKAYKAALEDAPADTSSGVEHGGSSKPSTNSAEVLASGGDSVDDVVAKLTKLIPSA